ncbi:hypothetical protein CRYPA_636 [uncultured Candidatus Thioglobus sp.]|nr:hypothetical protein CRYPA_636 [uncultured Candidatus Thioglobus sp.]
MKGLPYSFEQLSVQKPDVLTDNEAAYVEKIDQFALQEFDENQRLSHFVKSDYYFNFKNTPALLIEPKVSVYNEQGEIEYTLSSKRANYFDSGEIKFQGKVKVKGADGSNINMNTPELIVGTKSDEIAGNKQVTYLGENTKIVAQGMHVQKELMQMSGKVKVFQDSGSIINTRDLFIDQSSGFDVYRTDEKIHYQSQLADIKATGMKYEDANQKIRLTGGVVGFYE